MLAVSCGKHNDDIGGYLDYLVGRIDESENVDDQLPLSYPAKVKYSVFGNFDPGTDDFPPPDHFFGNFDPGGAAERTKICAAIPIIG